MAQIYKSVKIIEIGVGAGSGAPVFELTFTNTDWTLNSGNYEFTIAESLHQSGNNPLVQVEELDGSFYRVVETTVENNSGDIKLIIGDDSRFTGRVLIKG